MDLENYTPLGDKKNSEFFEEYLPRSTAVVPSQA